MANRITGSDGQCTVADHNILFNTWSATFSQVVTDVTAFADPFANKRGGLMSGTFSASGVMKDNASTTIPMPKDGGGLLAFDPAGEAVTLQTGSTTKTNSQWSGTAIIGNVSPTSTQGGDASISVDGEFTGNITITWDESA
jgi:hypothetical protein